MTLPLQVFPASNADLESLVTSHGGNLLSETQFFTSVTASFVVVAALTQSIISSLPWSYDSSHIFKTGLRTPLGFYILSSLVDTQHADRPSARWTRNVEKRKPAPHLAVAYVLKESGTR